MLCSHLIMRGQEEEKNASRNNCQIINYEIKATQKITRKKGEEKLERNAIPISSLIDN